MHSTPTMGATVHFWPTAEPYDVAPRLSVRCLIDEEGGNWCWICPVCRSSGSIGPSHLTKRRWHVCQRSLFNPQNRVNPPESYPEQVQRGS